MTDIAYRYELHWTERRSGDEMIEQSDFRAELETRGRELSARGQSVGESFIHDNVTGNRTKP